MLGFVTFLNFALGCTNDVDCDDGEFCVNGVCKKGKYYLDRIVSQII